MISNTPRKVCAVLVDRANYGRLKPVLSEIKSRPELQLHRLTDQKVFQHAEIRIAESRTTDQTAARIPVRSKGIQTHGDKRSRIEELVDERVAVGVRHGDVARRGTRFEERVLAASIAGAVQCHILAQRKG